jgi:hypothetical protein
MMLKGGGGIQYVTAAVPFQWPNASTTGYGSTSLTPSGATTISTPGTYTALSFSQGVNITSSNVTLSQSLVTMLTTDGVGIDVSPGLTNVVIDHVEIIGAGTSATTENSPAIQIPVTSQVTVTNTNINQCSQGFNLSGESSGTGRTITISKNYLNTFNGASGSHYDGLYYGGEAPAGFSLLISGNNINMSPQTQTATVFIESFFGNVSNITVMGNLLVGGSNTLYAECTNASFSVSNTSITNNAMGVGSAPGYFDFSNAGGGVTVTQSGNYDYISLTQLWSPSKTYASGDIAVGNDGIDYKSLQNGNLDNATPNGGGTNSWWTSSF